MSMTIEERLDRLERHCGIKQPEVKIPSPEPEGVRITTEIFNRAFWVPTRVELRSLYKIVLARFPELRPRARWNQDQDLLDREHFESFAGAFLALGQIDRRDNPDEKRSLVFWIETADDMLNALGRSRCATAGFVPAVIAHGDVPFTPLGSVYSLSVGLVAGSGGRKATDAWRRVLAGHLLEPVVSERERNARGNSTTWNPGRVIR